MSTESQDPATAMRDAMAALVSAPAPRAGARIEASAETQAAWAARAGLGGDQYDTYPSSSLYGVPVLLDNTLPPGAWRMIARNGDEIARGGYPEESA